MLKCETLRLLAYRASGPAMAVAILAMSVCVFGAEGTAPTREEMIRSIETRIQQRVDEAVEVKETQDEMVRQLERTAMQEAEALRRATPMDLAMRNASQVAALCFDPGDTIVEEGAPFSTDLILRSHAQKTFNSADLILSYDPIFLEPVSVHDHHLRGVAAREPEFWIDETEGTIRYRIELSQSVAFFTQPLLTVIWKAKRATEGTMVDLRLPLDRSSVRLGSSDILSNELLPRGALVAMGVTILPKTTDWRRGFFPDNQAAARSMPAFSGDEVFLALAGPESVVEPGTEFVVGVRLWNPNRTQFDGLSLWIQFPPERVQVLDWDKGNWIRRGVNIHDAPSQQNFPFDFHIANEVFQESGEIIYQMGSSRRPLSSEGVVAQIRARALAPVSTNDFRLIGAAPGETKTTDVSFMGVSVLAPSSLHEVRQARSHAGRLLPATER